MKKIIVTIVVISMILSLMGCSNKVEKKPETDTTNTSVSKQEGNEAKKTEEKPKLTYWFPLSSFLTDQVTNFGETPIGKQLQENTGIDIEFIHPAGDTDDETKNALNLLIASGKYPDIVEYKYYDHYQGGPDRAIEDGFLMDLTDLIPKYAPDLYKYLQEHPEVDKAVKSDSGKYYCFPFLRGDPIQTVFFGPMVRTDYLDKLDLEKPETIDDWYNILTAFKNDLELPTPFTYESWMNKKMLSVMMGAYKTANEFFVDDNGKVIYGPATQEYKAFLTEYKKWYDEGLLDVDIAAIDKKQVQAKIVNNEAGAAMGYSGSRLGAWLRATEDPEFNMVGVKYPVLTKGEKPFFGQRSHLFTGQGAAITTQCEDVETALRLLNYGFTEEGHMLYDYGIEGITYEMRDGKPYYTQKWNDSDNRFRNLYVRTTSYGPFVQGPRHNFGEGYLPQQLESIKTWEYSDVAKHMMPMVSPSEDELDEYVMNFNQIESYREEMFYKFLFGQESLDSFDKYVRNMENMNLARVTEIMQNAVDRYNNR